MQPDSVKREFVEILDERWQEDYESRAKSVPKPNIVLEGEKSERSVHMGDEDVVFVRSGGNWVIEPASIGYRSERREVPIDIEIYTSEGEKRFEGIQEDEQYGGLVGEVERILDSLRQGYNCFDQIIKQSFTDQVSEYGADMWVGSWSANVLVYSRQISQQGYR